MFFSAKTKGYFVEQNDQAILLARTSSPVAPMVIEELRECPAGDPAALTEAMTRIQPKKGPSGYMNACCAVYPSKRLVRRATLEPKRLKEPTYFSELLSTQFRVEPDKYTIHVLNSADGLDLDVNKGTQKEALFCGMLAEEVTALQEGLLASEIYPEQLELGTVSMLGAVVNYLAFTKSKTPTLVLEIGADTTHSFIVTAAGVEASRPIPQGLESMVPVVQKELGLKDEESAKKLFYSNTFDFTGMGPLLIKKLLKELQSSIGFYEVQTGQSIGQVLCTMLPAKLNWIDDAISTALGVSGMRLDLAPWLLSRQVTTAEGVVPKEGLGVRWLGLVSLMANYNLTDAVAAEKEE